MNLGELAELEAVVTIAELETAVIRSEYAAGLTPPGVTRPLFPWERHTDFKDIDRTLTRGYAETATILFELRDEIAQLIGHELTEDELLALLLKPTAEIRKLLNAAALKIARAMRRVQLSEAKRTLRDAHKQGIRPAGPTRVASIAEWRTKGRLIVQSLWHHIAEAVVNTARDTTDRDARTAVDEVSIKAAQDQARQTVHQAAAAGRTQALDVMETPKQIYASELLDSDTCGPCSHVDGKQYDSVDEALADYPGNGGYRYCDGAERCRGSLVLVWDETDPTINDAHRPIER